MPDDRRPALQELLGSPFVERALRRFLGGDLWEIVTRPACHVVRSASEGSGLARVRRALFLPPGGFTADEIDLLSPHPEARSIRARIEGRVNAAKRGFLPLVGEVELAYSRHGSIPTEASSSSARFSEQHCGRVRRSWRNWFYVVRKNGWGDSHNLINRCSDWVLILIEKELADHKPIAIRPYLERLPGPHAAELAEALARIERRGDEIFRDTSLVSRVIEFPPAVLAPILIRMLNTPERGRHEPCTFFALILKVAKRDRDLVVEEMERARRIECAPRYYLEDLARKLNR
jgi:hypothetical protein